MLQAHPCQGLPDRPAACGDRREVRGAGHGHEGVLLALPLSKYLQLNEEGRQGPTYCSRRSAGSNPSTVSSSIRARGRTSARPAASRYRADPGSIPGPYRRFKPPHPSGGAPSGPQPQGTPPPGGQASGVPGPVGAAGAQTPYGSAPGAPAQYGSGPAPQAPHGSGPAPQPPYGSGPGPHPPTGSGPPPSRGPGGPAPQNGPGTGDPGDGERTP